MFSKADCVLIKLADLPCLLYIYKMKICCTNVPNFRRIISFSIIIIISQNEHFSFYIKRSND